MSSIQAYKDLDVSPDSDAFKSLMSKAEQEAGRSSIELTSEGDEGALAHGLTTGMKSWLQKHVGPKRAAAISEVETKARAIEIAHGTNGVLDRVEVDKLKRDRAKRRSDVTKAFHDRNATQLRDYNDAHTEYNAMRFREGGRDPKIPNRFIEWGVLLPLIMIPEGLLNFESFRRAPIIQSDFQALGATIIVGIGIALAAHMVGLFVRQFNYYMKADDDHQNRSGLPMLGLGVVLLLVSLGVVGYARYYYLLPQIEEAIMLGQKSPNILLQVGSLLLGNLVVFLIGTVLTFKLHDPNPAFSDKGRLFRKLKKEYTSLQKKEVNNRLAELDRAFKENKDKTDEMTIQLTGLPDYFPIRTGVDAIDAKDSEILGVLSEYKELLAGHLDSDFQFDLALSDGNHAMGSEKLSISKFSSLSMKLLWS